MAKLKICGLFREEDIDAANEARPDYIGFVFAKSRRQVSAGLAEKLRARLSEGIVPAGVFVNAAAEEIIALYQNGVISIAQLHGTEDVEYLKGLKKNCPGLPLIKALSINHQIEKSIGDATTFENSGADFLLLDSSSAGSGKTFDWSLLEGGYITRLEKPCFIAGGIGVDNITEALRFRPFGIDVSSGAETNGLKDRNKMMLLAKKLREDGGRR